MYLLPLRSNRDPSQQGEQAEPLAAALAKNINWDEDPDPVLVHALLQPLVGTELDFWAFARDTPKGKETSCKLLLARATAVRVPYAPAPADRGHEGSNDCSDPALNFAQGSSTLEFDNGRGAQSHVWALCVELVGNRFLRRSGPQIVPPGPAGC